MATLTTNYGLSKPEYGDTADIGVINEDMDLIDAQMKTNADAAASATADAAAATNIADNARQVAERALTPDSALNAANLTGTVPTACLPSYVDDVLDAYVVGDTPLAQDWLGLAPEGSPLTPEAGKIYVVVSAGEYQNRVFRWTGTAYVNIDNPLDVATQEEAETGTDNTKAMTPLRTHQAIDARTDSSLDADSENPIQNRAVQRALANKADKANATASAAGLMSAADKAKLDGMTAGAQPNVIEQVQLDGAVITPSDKAVNIQIGAGLRASGGTIYARSYYTYETVGEVEYLTHVIEIEED